MLPLLRELPEGEVGERVMTKALHLTFSLTTLVYATIGLAGYILFGDETPENILGGFKGAVGGVLAFVFCAYICLCFAPTVPPLRETLLRLLCATAPPPPPAADAAATATVSPGTPQNGSVQQASPCPPSLAGTSERRKARVQHVVLTAAIIGLVFLVVALLPGASATLFAFTGASGVCFVSFIFPVLAFVWLPRPSLFAPSVDVSPALDATSPPLEPQASPDEPYYRYSPPLSTRLLEAVGSHTPADFNPVSPPRRPRSAVGRAAAACVWYVGPCLILLFGFALTVLGLLDAVKSVAEGEAVCVHHHNHTA